MILGQNPKVSFGSYCIQHCLGIESCVALGSAAVKVHSRGMDFETTGRGSILVSWQKDPTCPALYFIQDLFVTLDSPHFCLNLAL